MKLFVFVPMPAHLVKLLWPFVILERKFMRLALQNVIIGEKIAFVQWTPKNAM